LCGFLLAFVSIGAGAQLLTSYFQETPAVSDVVSGPALELSLDSTVEEASSANTDPENERPVERKRKVAVVTASAEDLLRIAPTPERPATAPPATMPAPPARPTPPLPPALPSWVLNPDESKAKWGFVLSPMEQGILLLVNQEREKTGANALMPNEKLFAAARKHSENMARQLKLSHDLDGKTFADRCRAESYGAAGGENVAVGARSNGQVMAMWMSSPGHRANILNKGFTEIGIGAAIDKGPPYFTQVFGTARPIPRKSPVPNI
jgi:uncharacterized protein YkwD